MCKLCARDAAASKIFVVPAPRRKGAGDNELCPGICDIDITGSQAHLAANQPQRYINQEMSPIPSIRRCFLTRLVTTAFSVHLRFKLAFLMQVFHTH